MRKLMVNLNSIDDVKEFCEKCTFNADFDIDLVSGRYVIDAKSIMGIFSLDLSKPIELTIHCDEADASKKFLESIDRFLVK